MDNPYQKMNLFTIRKRSQSYMGRYLNSKLPFENYRSMVKDTYFVDKTDLISQLIPSLEKEKRFLCITRPGRFGKSVMANMIGAFFGKAGDGEEIFRD